MNTMKLCLACVIGVSLMCGCSDIQQALKLQRPTASLQGVHFQDVTMEAATIIFDVEVKNPYGVDLPLVNLDYQLAREQKPFLSGQADLKDSIPAGGSRVLPLPVKAPYLDVWRAFSDIRPGSIIPYQAQAGLSVDAPAVGRLRLPMTKKGELQIPKLPQASDISIESLLKKAKP